MTSEQKPSEEALLRAALEPDANGFSDAECIAILLDGYEMAARRDRLLATAISYKRAAWLIRSMSAAIKARDEVDERAIKGGRGMSQKSISERAEEIAGKVADRCHGERKRHQAPTRYATIWQAARLGALEALNIEGASVITATLKVRDDVGEPVGDPTHIISMTQAAFWTARENAAEYERAQIVKWLRDAFDQNAEYLCDKIAQINREQRAKGVFTGQPYFDAFANAIERGDHLPKAPETNHE